MRWAYATKPTRKGRGVNMEIGICWKDLTPGKQREIAGVMGMDVDEVVGQTNWDVFPIATMQTGEEEG
jgi:hypothetical protein